MSAPPPVGRLHSTAQFIPSPAWNCRRRHLDLYWQSVIALVLDRCRATVNVLSDTCVAVVARNKGATGVLAD